MPPAASLALSASASIRCLYSAVKLRRLALATTSGLGRSAIPRSPTVALRSSSLRSASLRSTDMAGEDVFVFFMLNFLPVLLCNQWYEKCLSYIGTEGFPDAFEFLRPPPYLRSRPSPREDPGNTKTGHF